MGTGVIISTPEDRPDLRFKSLYAPGFQFFLAPVYRINRPLAIRSGLSLYVRNNRFEQAYPWSAEYTEKSTSIGMPVLLQYSFGYSDIRVHLISGFHTHCLIRNNLQYSALAIPGYRQEGSVKISFDRRHLVVDLQLGIGLRYQVSRMYIGADLVLYVGLRNQNRFDPPRTIQLYQDGQPAVPYYSTGHWMHGIMINLVIRKERK